MTKAEMIQLVATTCETTHARAATALDALFDQIAADLAFGGRVRLPFLGTLVVRDYEGGPRRNPNTGAAITVAPRRRARLKMGRHLRERLNPPPAARQAAE